MDCYKNILQEIITQIVSVPHAFEIDHARLVEMKCYQAIKEIREILVDSSLSDANCFLKIEKIVCLLEDIGLSCGARHDFG